VPDAPYETGTPDAPAESAADTGASADAADTGTTDATLPGDAGDGAPTTDGSGE
jgi:hypothetical protein